MKTKTYNTLAELVASAKLTVSETRTFQAAMHNAVLNNFDAILSLADERTLEIYQYARKNWNEGAAEFKNMDAACREVFFATTNGAGSNGGSLYEGRHRAIEILEQEFGALVSEHAHKLWQACWVSRGEYRVNEMMRKANLKHGNNLMANGFTGLDWMDGIRDGLYCSKELWWYQIETDLRGRMSEAVLARYNALIHANCVGYEFGCALESLERFENGKYRELRDRWIFEVWAPAEIARIKARKAEESAARKARIAAKNAFKAAEKACKTLEEYQALHRPAIEAWARSLGKKNEAEIQRIITATLNKRYGQLPQQA